MRALVDAGEFVVDGEGYFAVFGLGGGAFEFSFGFSFGF